MSLRYVTEEKRCSMLHHFAAIQWVQIYHKMVQIFICLFCGFNWIIWLTSDTCSSGWLTKCKSFLQNKGKMRTITPKGNKRSISQPRKTKAVPGFNNKTGKVGDGWEIIQNGCVSWQFPEKMMDHSLVKHWKDHILSQGCISQGCMLHGWTAHYSLKFLASQERHGKFWERHW